LKKWWITNKRSLAVYKNQVSSPTRFDCSIPIRWLLTLALIVALNDAFGQAENHVLRTQLPLRDGFAELFDENDYRLVDPSDLISIYSDSSRVYSAGEGVVRNFSKFDTVYYVVVMAKGLLITYGNLKEIICTTGQKLRKGDLIGMVDAKDPDGPGLIFCVSDSLLHISYARTLKYLRQANVRH
jgi:hypothetical protein